MSSSSTKIDTKTAEVIPKVIPSFYRDVTKIVTDYSEPYFELDLLSGFLNVMNYHVVSDEEYNVRQAYGLNHNTLYSFAVREDLRNKDPNAGPLTDKERFFPFDDYDLLYSLWDLDLGIATKEKISKSFGNYPGLLFSDVELKEIVEDMHNPQDEDHGIRKTEIGKKLHEFTQTFPITSPDIRKIIFTTSGKGNGVTYDLKSEVSLRKTDKYFVLTDIVNPILKLSILVEDIIKYHHDPLYTRVEIDPKLRLERDVLYVNLNIKKIR